MLASLAPPAVSPALESRKEPTSTERAQPITHAKLLDALARHDYQPARAAKALGISRTTIYHHIQRDPTLGLVTRISESQLAKELKACDGDLHAVARRLKVSYRALQIRMNKA